MTYYVGIDNGGTATKAVLFDVFGKEVYAASNRTPLLVPHEGYQERDMDEVWAITAQTVRACIKASGVPQGEIAAVGCSGHGKGLYLWGVNDKPSYHAIASTDHRAKEIVKRWYADGTNEKAKHKDLQDVIECQPVALLRWLKENDPQVLEQTQWVFEAKDFIRFMLTGEAFAEITDYSGTCLMNLLASSFDRELLRFFGIEETYGMLPPIRYSTDICGHVTAKAAEETGLPEGIPVCGGMFDIDACAIAMGAHQSDDICVITGTWAINEYVSPKPDETGIRNSLFCLPGTYLIEESSPASAGNMEWIIENFLGKEAQECRQDGRSVYDFINQSVAGLMPDDSNVVFLPFLYGTNADPLDKACLFGLVNNQDIRHILRAVYEGVVFCHMNHIDRLMQGREKPAYLKLAGGVTKSEVWSQMFADVSGIPVKVVDADELGGLGCAIACAVAVGEYASLDDAVAEMVRISRVYQPDASKTEVYRRKYAQYNRLVQCLKGMYD